MKKPMMLISGWALLLTVALTGNAQAMATPCEALKYTVTNSIRSSMVLWAVHIQRCDADMVSPLPVQLRIHGCVSRIAGVSSLGIPGGDTCNSHGVERV